MKRYLSVISLVLVSSVMLSGCGLFKKKAPQTEEEPLRSLINEPVNQIPVSQRPYVTMVPSNDGRNIELVVAGLNKPASSAEFELEYTSGDLIQGAFGSIDLAGESGSYDILLGSCSTGGTCTYHEDVTGGSAIVSLQGEEDYAIKFNWRLQETAESNGLFGSQDQKIQLEGEDLFANSNYVVISETSGPPVPPEGEILSGPYGVFPANGTTDNTQATVNLRLSEATDSAQILGWDGNAWVELDTSINDKNVTTTGQVYQTYLVVSSS